MGFPKLGKKSSTSSLHSDAGTAQHIRPVSRAPGPPSVASHTASAAHMGHLPPTSSVNAQNRAHYPPPPSQTSRASSAASSRPHYSSYQWSQHAPQYFSYPPPGPDQSNSTAQPPVYSQVPAHQAYPAYPNSQGPPPATSQEPSASPSFWEKFIARQSSARAAMGPSWAQTALTAGIGAGTLAARGYLGDTLTSAICGATLLASTAWSCLSDVSKANTPSEMQNSSWPQIGVNYLARAKAGDQMSYTASALSLLGYTAFGGSLFSPGALMASSVASQGARILSTVASNPSTHP